MPNPKAFAHSQRFYGFFGWFHAVWIATELNIDCAIGKILKIPPEQTHALVGALEFGRKAAILRSLLPKSEYKNVPEIKGLLTRIRKESLRNVFTHSFIASDEETITFIHRSSQGQYSATGYRFTADDFVAHVRDFVQLATDFEKALGISTAELGDFASEAITEEKQG
jgi:hypothetical protein